MNLLDRIFSASSNLPFFGRIDKKNLQAYYSSEVMLLNSDIKIDLNFENQLIEEHKFKQLKNFLESIEIELNATQNYLFENLEEEQIKEFLDFHFENISHEKLKPLKDKLKVSRIGIYPDDDSAFVVMDFSFGMEVSNYVLAIKLNHDLDICDIAMES